MSKNLTSQIVAQGSYGLRKIDPKTGVDKGGNVMRVWHAHRNGEHVGTFLTREEARDRLRQCSPRQGLHE